MIRSAALRRYTRLRPRKPMRRTWMKRRSPRRIARETPAEREHKRLIREARVCVFRRYANVGRCRGPLQAAHFGHSGGTSAKAGTWCDTALACASHHAQWGGFVSLRWERRFVGIELKPEYFKTARANLIGARAQLELRLVAR